LSLGSVKENISLREQPEDRHGNKIDEVPLEKQ
jgi:hypothetical protein